MGAVKELWDLALVGVILTRYAILGQVNERRPGAIDKRSMRPHMQQEVSTEIIEIDPITPQPDLIERAAALLRAGEVVVFPTETVYGLGGAAFQEEAVRRIFAAKGRPFYDPLIVHIAEADELELLTPTIPEVARLLAQVFWPGPLTLLLPRGSRVPELVTAGLPTVAIRMPRHPVARALIRAAAVPIAAPSANRFMHISPTTAQHAALDLAGRVSLILDGGPCEIGVESTVLDLCAPVPTVLRPGGVSLEALRAVLPEVLGPPLTSSAAEVAQRAPGQLMTHYAPIVPLLLFEGRGEPLWQALRAEVQRRRAQGERVGLLLTDEDLAALYDCDAFLASLGTEAAPEQLAAALFARLRELEAAGVQVILCHTFDVQGLGLAIRDRLLRAAGGKIISVG